MTKLPNFKIGDVVMVDLSDNIQHGWEIRIWNDKAAHGNIGIIIDDYEDGDFNIAELLQGSLVHKSHLVKL